MKLTPLTRAMLLASALALTINSARGDGPSDPDLTVNSGYNATAAFTDPNANSITSFDWSSSNNDLYYQAADSGYNLVFNQVTPSGTVTPISLPAPTFAGSSVDSIGSYIYLNDGNSNIYTYHPGDSSAVEMSNGYNNYALFSNPGNSTQLYITGFDSTFTYNQISYASLSGTDGSVGSTNQVIETDSNSSGPLAFDSAGNLYYAPGAGDKEIYKWDAAEVANAATIPLTLSGSNVWFNYSSDSTYSGYLGGTSIAFDNDQLLITLTNYAGGSGLFAITMTGTGAADTANTILTNSADNLAQIRVDNGNLFVSDSTQILEIQAVPEPSSIFLIAFGLAGLIYFRTRRSKRLVPVAAVVTSTFFFWR